MKDRLTAALLCVLLLGAGMPPALAEEPQPTVTIQRYEAGSWYPLLVPDDTPLTAEDLPGAITGVDAEDRRWEVPVRWDLEAHQGETASHGDFTLHANPEAALAGPEGTTCRVETAGPAAEPFALPVYYFQRGPIGTDPRLSGLTGSYAPWRGLLTLSYNKIGTWEATPPGAERVLIQSSKDLVDWETARDVTGEAGGRFDVPVPDQREETLYYRVWVEGGPQAGASTEYVVLEANAQRPKTHTVTLEEGLVVGDGEEVVYLTVAEDLLDAPADGLYPGALTIQIDGQIVVESGGSLTIGTFASGGPEKRPVLQGALSQDGLIRVEPGGALELDGVTWELDGVEGYAILQEDGGAVELDHTELDAALIQWGAPLADNSHLVLEVVWLEAGTPLTQALLPREAETTVLDHGASARLALPIRWALGEDAGRTEGEAVVGGTFLDEAGEPMPMLAPLEAAVRWYAPEEIPLTGTSWLGDAAPTARLAFRERPAQAAELWGEWSEDEGGTWIRWDRCEFGENESGPYCVFAPPDSAPRLYRVAAVSADGTRHWASEGVLLPAAGTVPEDPDGNRGGSTGVVRPDREPEPEEESDHAPARPAPPPPEVPLPPAPPPPAPTGPEVPLTATASPSPAPEQTAAPGPELVAAPPPSAPPEAPAMAQPAAPLQDPEPAGEGEHGAPPEAPGPLPEAATPPEPGGSPPPAPTEPAQEPEGTPAPEAPGVSPPQPETSASPAPAGAEGKAPPASAQAALAAAGLGGCVLAGLGLTGSGPFKRKR